MELDSDIESFLLRLQEQVTRLTLENESLRTIIQTKNRTIYQLEDYILKQTPTDNEVHRGGETQTKTPLDPKKIENMLYKRGMFVHPKLAHVYTNVLSKQSANTCDL